MTKEQVYKEALEHILNPIAHLQKQAENSGDRFNGHVALVLSNDPEYLKEVAERALEYTPPIEGETNPLLTVLLELKDNPYDVEAGICYNLSSGLDCNADTPSYPLTQVLKTYWDKYSGKGLFPIPSGDSTSPETAFTTLVHKMWDPDTAYGSLRLEALDVLIKHYKEFEQHFNNRGYQIIFNSDKEPICRCI